MIESVWRNYKDEFLEKGTNRTMDTSQNNITTSEGQSYTMLRAVWMDDRDTFDKSWQWTQDNLQHSNDHLFSWLFGQLPNGKYGIITERGGNNSASDADSDIALALAFAYKRWGDQAYLTAAQNIAADMWTNEVVSINGRLYLAADNIEKNDPSRILVNPSYISPYAYRVFAQIDPTHNWKKLIDDSYTTIGDVLRLPLDKSKSVSIPPDWVEVDKKTGTIRAVTNSNLTTNYSFDAMRLPWRLALDWQWNKEPRAESTLKKMSFFDEQWNQDKAVYASYTHDGDVLIKSDLPAIYGGTLGYFMVADPAAAQELYNNKLVSLYSPDKNAWKENMSYYDDNWAWFGVALYNQYLLNLYAVK
jgi:endoglucanase